MTQPGWYPDPAGAGSLRWWSGEGWTEHVSSSSATAEKVDLTDEASWARRARIALVVAVPAQILGLAGFRAQMRSFLDRLPELSTGTPPSFASGGWARPMQLAGAASTLIGVLFLLWFSRSAANGRALGLPARREPAAGVAGFVVPVINLWWPYQSTCDLLPPGDGHRPLVLRWFLLWIVGGFVGGVASWVSLLVTGWGGWLLLAVPAVLTTLAAMEARRVIAVVLATHESLALP